MLLRVRKLLFISLLIGIIWAPGAASSVFAATPHADGLLSDTCVEAGCVTDMTCVEHCIEEQPLSRDEQIAPTPTPTISTPLLSVHFAIKPVVGAIWSATENSNSENTREGVQLRE